MRRKLLLLMAAPSCLALSACGDSSEPEAQATDVPQAVASNAAAAAQAVESQFGTPVKDRVATLGLLNKRNNEQQDIVLKVGEAKRVGSVVVKLASCEKTLPWERPGETGAFVQVFVEQRAQVSDPLRWQKVFSGWLFRNSPGLNVVQHPVYDVWVKDCAMNFPGEEENPADFAAAKSVSKASGSDSATPSAEASPAPAPSPAAPD
jgi:hypothetical protein